MCHMHQPAMTRMSRIAAPAAPPKNAGLMLVCRRSELARFVDEPKVASSVALPSVDVDVLRVPTPPVSDREAATERDLVLGVVVVSRVLETDDTLVGAVTDGVAGLLAAVLDRVRVCWEAGRHESTAESATLMRLVSATCGGVLESTTRNFIRVPPGMATR